MFKTWRVAAKIALVAGVCAIYLFNYWATNKAD